MNRPRIIRLILEEVNGVIQGACVPFLDGAGLDRGVNRLAFGPDGSLWTGHTHLSWAGGEGMRRIRYRESAAVHEVRNIAITSDGFKVTFTQPLDELSGATLSRYTFKYHPGYGSPQLDKAAVDFAIARLSGDTFQLTLAEPLRPDFCYEFHFPSSANPMLCYTVREIPLPAP